MKVGVLLWRRDMKGWKREEGAVCARRGVRVDSLWGARGTLIGLLWESGSVRVLPQHPQTRVHPRKQVTRAPPSRADCTIWEDTSGKFDFTSTPVLIVGCFRIHPFLSNLSNLRFCSEQTNRKNFRPSEAMCGSWIKHWMDTFTVNLWSEKSQIFCSKIITWNCKSQQGVVHHYTIS